MKRPEKNKWFLCFNTGKAYQYMSMGWYNISFGCFKLLEDPVEGREVCGYKYKGFYYSFLFWLPIY